MTTKYRKRDCDKEVKEVEHTCNICGVVYNRTSKFSRFCVNCKRASKTFIDNVPEFNCLVEGNQRRNTYA